MNGYLDNSGGVGVQFVLLPVLIISVLSFVIGVLYLVSIIKIYSKAGKPWWAAIIPIYNIIVLMDIANLSYKNLLLILIPIVGMFIFMIKLYIGVAKTFNRSTGFAIGMIFLPIIFLPLLAFSKDSIGNKDGGNLDNSKAVVLDSIENVNTESNSDQSVVMNNFDSVNNKPIENISDDLIYNNQNIINDNSNVTLETQNVEIINENSIETFNDASLNSSLSNNIPFEEIDINSINNGLINTESVVSTSLDNSMVEQVNTKTFDNSLNSMDVLETFPNNTNGNAKYCKNCGIEIPKIVTICPKCGTDNE